MGASLPSRVALCATSEDSETSEVLYTRPGRKVQRQGDTRAHPLSANFALLLHNRQIIQCEGILPWDELCNAFVGQPFQADSTCPISVNLGCLRQARKPDLRMRCKARGTAFLGRPKITAWETAAWAAT